MEARGSQEWLGFKEVWDMAESPEEHTGGNTVLQCRAWDCTLKTTATGTTHHCQFTCE